MNCEHEWVEISEGFELIGGDLWEKSHEVCAKCGVNRLNTKPDIGEVNYDLES